MTTCSPGTDAQPDSFAFTPDNGARAEAFVARYPAGRQQSAVLPLLDHLEPGCVFEEPCCGDGQLALHLENFGHTCVACSDIAIPVDLEIDPLPLDAREITSSDADYFITNPPWQRDVMHGIIENLSRLVPTWRLIDADWMHTKQSAWYMERCSTVVSIGRVKWIEGSKATGKEDYVWMRFGDTEKPTLFYGRQQ